MTDTQIQDVKTFWGRLVDNIKQFIRDLIKAIKPLFYKTVIYMLPEDKAAIAIKRRNIQLKTKSKRIRNKQHKIIMQLARQNI